MLGTASLLLSAFAIFLYNSSEWTWADWTGIGKDTSEIEEETLQNGKLIVTKRITHYQSGKNLWDWLGLAGVIAIPVVLFQFEEFMENEKPPILWGGIEENALIT